MSTPDELAAKAIGERIQTIRTRTGRTRAVVAGLVGRSEDWLLRDVEKGRLQHPPGLEMLLRIGQALGVRDLTEITGEHELLVGISRRAGHPVVPAIREAIEGVDLTPSPSPVGTAELAARVERGWRLWHTSDTPRADAGAMLPELIRDGRRALRTMDGQERRAAAAALSGAYALSEQVLAWVADAPLLWLAADRCMSAAEIADDPVTLASASWVLGNVWRSTGREDDAYHLASDAVALLEPRLVLQRHSWVNREGGLGGDSETAGLDTGGGAAISTTTRCDRPYVAGSVRTRPTDGGSRVP
ncbi:helix-turn-helix domain-containing protein [Nocardia sp. IBHARD005]|uniref:helix-turn-helix domain-containing protein n=1 Tax=Nocardia sp. IBHARD005 TaxID=3457765 RepID=UPI004059AD17